MAGLAVPYNADLGCQIATASRPSLPEVGKIPNYLLAVLDPFTQTPWVKPRRQSTIMEEDIAQIWHEVEDRVLRMANGDRSQLNEGMDIEGVLRHLESTQASDQKASEASKRVRGVISGTLASIQTVGEVVANVASNVRQLNPIIPICDNRLNPLIKGIPTSQPLLWCHSDGYQGMARVRRSFRGPRRAHCPMWRIPRAFELLYPDWNGFEVDESRLPTPETVRGHM